MKTKKSLLTTAAGIFAGIPQILQGIANKDHAALITGISTILLGLLAKDANIE